MAFDAAAAGAALLVATGAGAEAAGAVSAAATLLSVAAAALRTMARAPAFLKAPIYLFAVASSRSFLITTLLPENKRAILASSALKSLPILAWVSATSFPSITSPLNTTSNVLLIPTSYPHYILSSLLSISIAIVMRSGIVKQHFIDSRA